MALLLWLFLFGVVPGAIVIAIIGARKSSEAATLPEPPAAPLRRLAALRPRRAAPRASASGGDSGPRVNRFGELED